MRLDSFFFLIFVFVCVFLLSLFKGLNQNAKFFSILNLIFLSTFGLQQFCIIFCYLIFVFVILQQIKNLGVESRNTAYKLLIGLNLISLFGLKYFFPNFIILGFSYLTLQIIGLLMILSNEQIVYSKNFVSFLGVSAFFPTFLAGPINKHADLISQFEKRESYVFQHKKVLLLFASGFFKKSCGDLLFQNIEKLLTNGSQSSIQSVIVLFGISSWFFLDFSSYTDLARAAALSFGIKINDNFNLPFLSQTASEFWNKWHISLTQWLKLNFYFPVSLKIKLNFPSASQKVVSLLLVFSVFFLIACWHKIQVNFIYWGIYNSLLVFSSSGLINVYNFLKIPFFLRVILNFLLLSIGQLFVYQINYEPIFAFVFTPKKFVFVYSEILNIGLVLLTILIPHLSDWLIIKKFDFLEKRFWIALVVLYFIFAIFFSSNPASFRYVGY